MILPKKTYKILEILHKGANLNKRIKLSNITISHISLVKAGANGKEVIYKSADKEPTYIKEIKIAKQDDERGVLYGIVYSPDDVDSQGDEASAAEIQKAAYNFMKNRNTTNVDKDHDFVKKEAYIAESWILRKDDAIFPDEKEGSWAVAVQLESDSLKEAVKKGEIAGLSMAGTAERKTVEKATKQETKNALEALLGVFKNLSVSINGYLEKQEKESELAKKDKNVEEITKSTEAILKAFEDVTKSNEEIKKQNETLAKRLDDVEATLKKSKQDETPRGGETKNSIRGVL